MEVSTQKNVVSFNVADSFEEGLSRAYICDQNHAKMMKNYVSPAVLSRCKLELENNILQSSVVEFIGTVESTGQNVHNFDWNNQQPYFNHNWDEL